MRNRFSSRFAGALCAAAFTIIQALPAGAGLLVNFPFDEGSGKTTADTVSGAVGWLGYQNPVTDQVMLMDASPSGQPGDRCITNSGRGFLLVDDSVNPILDITNGPITIETWVYLDLFSVAKSSEGLVGYGQSYKMGMKGGRQVFTLFGIKDFTNTTAAVPAGQWTHLAAAWEPGVGIHFYMDGNHTLVADTTPAARPVLHNLLSIGSESPTNGNNTLCAMDRVRVHNALLDASQIDSDPANPKALQASTLVSYDFNEASFPSQSAIAPSRPTVVSSDFYANTALPVWTTDTPSGLASDYALAFNMGAGPIMEKERVTIDNPTLDLRSPDNTTNYTFEAWVKLPETLIYDREVLFRTFGPAPRISVSIDLKRNLHTTVWGSADYASGVIIPNDNQWHHIAISMWGRTNVQFFLDGVLRQSMPGNAKAATGDTSTGFLIGQESNTRYFRGLLDRVRVWDAPLTAAELDFPAVPGRAIVTTQPASLVVDAGAAAVFAPAVDSSTSPSYQWFYKPYPSAETGTPVADANDATLTLNNVTADKQGWYYLRVINDAGTVYSYPAQLAVRSGPQWNSEGFEVSKYDLGAFENQDLWTVDQNAATYSVSTAAQIEEALTSVGLTPGQAVHGGTQAVLITGPGAASVAIRQVPGFESQNNVTLDFWARPLTAGTTALVTNNVFLTMENSAGTRAAAIRFGPSRSIDYNSGNAWISTGLTWDDQTWYRFTIEADYATRKYDVYINGTKINASPLNFYLNTSDKFQQIRIYRGANQAGIILDDMTASAPLRISNISADGESINLTWQGGLAPYQLQRRSSLTTGDWENVGGVTSATQATDAKAAGPMFYRVVGQ